MNSRKLSYKSQLTSLGNEEPFACRNQDNQQPILQRPERKSSFVIQRPALTDMSINIAAHFQNKSNSKISRNSTIEYSRNPSNRSNANISGTKVLTNQREVMDFIMNLKSKKVESKSNRVKKQTQAFEIQQKNSVRQDLLCNRMLSIKKIEKYEKEAIVSYYEKDYQRCFGELGKAEALIRRQNIDSPQHMLYINYLYSEFYFKLKQNDKWRSYLLKAKSWISKIPIAQIEAMKEYILNVKALEICLALHEEQYQKVLMLVDELKGEESLSTKIRKRCCFTEITACRKLYRYKDALNAIDAECLALEQDFQIDQQKKEEEFGKLIETKIQLTAQFQSTQKAIELVEKLINFEEVSAGTAETFVYYNYRVYQLYTELLRKQQKEQIKLIFFLEKWLERQSSEKVKLKIQLQIFTSYYEMGIYTKALDVFENISQENLMHLGHQYLFRLASIKHVNGEESQAIGILTKVVEICEQEETKVWYMYKTLEFELQEERESLREQSEKQLQNVLRTYEGSNRGQIVRLYEQYLIQKGEQERAAVFAHKFRKRRTSSVNKLTDCRSDNKGRQGRRCFNME